MVYIYIKTFLNMPKRSFSDLEDKKKVNAWSEKNEFKPDEVSMYSHKKAKFNCYNEDCGHEFESMIHHISSGSWCPFCSQNRKLCGEKSCIPCHKNSFASFKDKDKVNALSEKNRFKAHEVTIFSHKKAIFKCFKCRYEFESYIYDISKHGTWCKFCYAIKNKFIKKLFEIFDKMNIEYDFETPVKCEGRDLRWDMVVYKNGSEFYIEVDGEHHFSIKSLMDINRRKFSNEYIENQFKDQRRKDLLKENHIIDNDKLLFRISYRQFNKLEFLVKEMISKSDDDDKGIVKMDDIYDW